MGMASVLGVLAGVILAIVVVTWIKRKKL